MKTDTPTIPRKIERHHDEPQRPVLNRELWEGGVEVLTFDRPDSPANIFDPSTLDELERHLDRITGDAGIRGLVLASAKPSIFLAGADLDFVANASGDELTKFIETGQRVFSKLAALRVPTVATIHGACLGGGTELALACDCRLASPDKVTRIGLPETQLGILPAWGGSTRLPRLIGLGAALDLILSGKILAAVSARRLGLVDDLVPRERLIGFAVRKIDGREATPGRSGHFLRNNVLSARITRRVAHARLLKKTRGNYPAIGAAIDVVCDGLGGTVAESLEMERRAVLELATTDAARQLMRVYHLQEHAKKFHAADHGAVDVERAAVIGAGVMGAGIAHWLGSRQIPVVLRDIDESKVAGGMRRIGKLFAEGVKRRVFARAEARRLQDFIAPAAEPVPLHRVDLVVEAAVEDLEIKKTIFADLCARVRPDTILATNTSALPIGELAADPRVTHPERLIGIHFFNPVHRMKLVEVVVTDHTSAEVVESALKFVRRIGKLPVVVRDRPGFVVNRILMPYLIEAGRMCSSAGLAHRKLTGPCLTLACPWGRCACSMKSAWMWRCTLPERWRGHLVRDFRRRPYWLACWRRGCSVASAERDSSATRRQSRRSALMPLRRDWH